jgi:hypothetical protein
MPDVFATASIHTGVIAVLDPAIHQMIKGKYRNTNRAIAD